MANWRFYWHHQRSEKLWGYPDCRKVPQLPEPLRHTWMTRSWDDEYNCTDWKIKHSIFKEDYFAIMQRISTWSPRCQVLMVTASLKVDSWGCLISVNLSKCKLQRLHTTGTGKILLGALRFSWSYPAHPGIFLQQSKTFCREWRPGSRLVVRQMLQDDGAKLGWGGYKLWGNGIL